MNKKEIVSYETDASRLIGKANKVVFVKKVEEISYLIKTNNLDIVPRGAGTSLVGGCIPNNSLVVDLNKLNNIISLNLKQGIIYVEAGICIKELNSKLSKVGLEFPINPSNNGVSTIGGMIATNASDNRSLKYNQIRDWVEEIEIINGRGELIKATKADLMDFCGMEGITGIIVRAKLRLIRTPIRTASIFQSDSFEEVLSIARRLKLEKNISMLDLFNKEVSVLLGFPEKYHLIIVE